ncbi:TPA: hypothetical protein ACSPZR_001589 [Aeromonas veronii]
MEDDLTWLAQNVHEWHFFTDALAFVNNGVVKWQDPNLPRKPSFIDRDQWLSRRAELQNKPSWNDAPEWANWLCQRDDGMWFWCIEEPGVSESGWETRHEARAAYPSGDQIPEHVLGDWRDTLERRPVDLSEPAGGVKERGADGAEENNAMAQRLLVALKSDPRSFDTGALAEMVELADAEIVKRDAKVCGGEGCLNNHWFERGELPPVGVECEVRIGEDWRRTKVVAALDSDVGKLPIFTTPWCSQHYVDCGPEQFRPIRTERDLAVEEMMKDAGALQWETPMSIMRSLYDAGYRKQSLPAD